MQVHIDYRARLAKLQQELADNEVDVLVGTRLKTITYLAGVFVPWRSALVVPASGEPRLYTVSMDAVRIGEEGVLADVRPYARIPMMDVVAAAVKDLGLGRGRIGIEDGFSWYVPEGMVTHEEFTMLEAACPDAQLVNLTEPIDRMMLLKEPEQIQLMRQATAICDAAQVALREQVRPGMTEIEIAGVAEHALRDRGSEFAWTFTGGQEIASGPRSWTGACTPPTSKVVQAGEALVLDVHGMYGLMLGDVSHNAVMGTPTPAQQRLEEAYVESSRFLLESLKPGRTIGEVAKAAREFTVEQGWGDLVRGFGHGIGHFGNEWFPSFTDVPMRYVSDPDIVLEPGFMEVMALTCNQEGVGGFRLERPVVITETGFDCLSATPLEPWHLDA